MACVGQLTNLMPVERDFIAKAWELKLKSNPC